MERERQCGHLHGSWLFHALSDHQIIYELLKKVKLSITDMNTDS